MRGPAEGPSLPGVRHRRSTRHDACAFASAAPAISFIDARIVASAQVALIVDRCASELAPPVAAGDTGEAGAASGPLRYTQHAERAGCRVPLLGARQELTGTCPHQVLP